ncbi:hypothetical protein [Aeromonas dhakensis]|uniref:primase 1D-like protein n=1 Tax=Aeromonas dhakensis TaxID=196024 RepID=UPI0029DBF22C|nr:hypothetical protein [Aeromonas dhakensis]MDX7696357.1 hypothetical protein [Aeromonas dhakensis]
MTSFDHIKKIIEKNPEVDVFRFFTFSFSNKVQTRLGSFSDSEENSIKRAISYKKENSSSFWESFFATSVSHSDIQNRILKEAIHHNKNRPYIHILNKDILDFLEKNEYENLAINSKVILRDGQIKHIPMLDFKIKSSTENTAFVQAVINTLGQTGSVLDSGKSYHFIGDTLITKNELTKLLANFILFHPISDKSWAAHQLIEGSASLRISKKYGVHPRMIEPH